MRHWHGARASSLPPLEQPFGPRAFAVGAAGRCLQCKNKNDNTKYYKAEVWANLPTTGAIRGGVDLPSRLVAFSRFNVRLQAGSTMRIVILLPLPFGHVPGLGSGSLAHAFHDLHASPCAHVPAGMYALESIPEVARYQRGLHVRWRKPRRQFRQPRSRCRAARVIVEQAVLITSEDKTMAGTFIGRVNGRIDADACMAPVWFAFIASAAGRGCATR
ncbi:hypothetical protein C8F04DRAFT_1405521 [Mycena alexandri]|uniref:Uncharacterized protein n=1 Tax=Mycena alexandri TaxID=1745969 RepID=A0AAD6WM83_9AGAR|nr:hypothetical protein C8F04DRAFT_1405521 [Mycena alexandri]